jgi:sterol desaturase/sphingolipid hydroxylase (fatty acid hydroxylase superfamily)
MLLANEPLLRLGAFAAVFAALLLWELLAPRRRQTTGRLQRWPSNLGIVVLDTLILRLLFPTAAVGVALLGELRGWGLLNALQTPAWLSFVAALILLDLTMYLQHVLFHAVPGLWRLHRVHHADLEFDVTTGIRFHPFEILLSMLIKLTVVVALGAPAVAVLVFEVVLNAASMFNHSNVRLPLSVDRVLRWIVVTPDMHRVHHSIVMRETNSNYGFNLPWWDRLLGTYRAQPAAGHEGMTIGIEQFREPRELRLDRMLLQPFRGAGGIARRPRGQPAAAASASRDDPDRVHDAGDVAEQRQQNVQPEVRTQSDLQKNAERRQQDREDDSQNVHQAVSFGTESIGGCKKGAGPAI